MVRPKLNRIIVSPPAIASLMPYGRMGRCSCKGNSIHITYDEYEAVRLIDYEGMQQADAAKQMNISRPTLTRIYAAARNKIATAMVEGRPIMLSDGNIEFEHYQQQKSKTQVMNQKIAIPTSEGKLWPHFGKAPQVTFATIEDGKIKQTDTLQAPPHEHGAMPKFIAEHGATDVLCGGLGQGAVDMLNKLGIQVHGGAPAIEVDKLLAMYLGGTIVYGDSSCHHTCHHDH